MYGVMFSIFNLVFTLIYFLKKKDFKNMKSFIDALYYTLNVSTTLAYGDITPVSKAAKIATMVHVLIVFFSVSSFIFQQQSNFLIFSVVNLLIIVGMIFLYKKIDPALGKNYMDYTYFSVMTHTTLGFGDHKLPLADKTKLTVVIHILFMFIMLNTFNSGIFSIMKGIVAKDQYY